MKRSIGFPDRRPRRAATALCLAAMLLAGFSRFPLSTFLGHLRTFSKLNALPRDRRRIAATGFLFDRAYGRFLLALSRRLPSDATLCLAVPPSNESYVYEAAYMLAPRRVIVNAPEDGCEEAAIFPAPPDHSPGPREELLDGGLLRRLR
jgi:hypothetical protein